MSVILIALPIFGFGIGYFYGAKTSSKQPTDDNTFNVAIPVAPPVNQELLKQIKDGVKLNHIEEKKSNELIVYQSNNEALMNQLKQQLYKRRKLM